MHEDQDGFWYPSVVESACNQCGLCVSVCPILAKIALVRQPKAYACINVDELARVESSSGGIFTAIAECVIAERGVVFGASFAEDHSVHHVVVECVEDLPKLRGSKYLQSRIEGGYQAVKSFLELGRKVLFVGTPCQIAGLKAFLGKEHDNLVCVDIICHGVPSPKVWQKYIAYRESRAQAKARRISFRRKDRGWKRYSVSFSFNNDTEYLQTHDKDLYMRTFLRDVCLRPSCYACKFKTLNRHSDITLADFWGVQDVLPDMDDDLGTSLVLVNSNRGAKIFEEIKNKVSYREVNIELAIAYNGAAIKSALLNPNRGAFFKELDYLPFDRLVDKYCSDSTIVRAKGLLKSTARVALKQFGLLSAAKRIWKGVRMK